MLRKSILLLFMLVCLVMFYACGSDNTTDGDVDGDVESNVDGDDETDTSEMEQSEDGDIDQSEVDQEIAETVDGDDENGIEEEAEVETEPLACSDIWTESLTEVNSVTGKVVDESDNPLAEASVVFCVFQDGDMSVCLNPVKTDSTGKFTIAVPENRRCMRSAAIHVVKHGDSRVGMYCEVDFGDTDELDVGEFMLPSIPASTRDTLGVTLNPHEIKASDGTTLTVVPDNMYFFEYGYTDINIMTWDSALYGWPCFIDEANPPQGLVALTPEVDFGDGNANTARNDAVHLAFVNTKNLAAKTVVNLWGLGGTATFTNDNTKVEEGQWTIIGEATVTDDQTMITTLSGEGLPFFTWFGWTEKE